VSTNEIIVTIGIAIISTIAAYVKIKISNFTKKYGEAIETIDTKFKEQIGQDQYNKDVEVIKSVINELDINKKDISIEVATEIIKQVSKKVKFNDSEILDIITKIIKGLL
jgi:AraC-like DNA-binding protein